MIIKESKQQQSIVKNSYVQEQRNWDHAFNVLLNVCAAQRLQGVWPDLLCIIYQSLYDRKSEQKQVFDEKSMTIVTNW